MDHSGEKCYFDLGIFTDMNDVTIFVNHNIAIMTIFDLQQETKDTVGRHWSYEIASCRFETLTTFITKFLQNRKEKHFSNFSCKIQFSQ